ncbi:MAG TPA: hypothetical protein VMA86_04970, partial [Acetobacteraceae bacterium]|nr:hypothetical protein [Acetobacteraceae bacterium]
LAAGAGRAITSPAPAASPMTLPGEAAGTVGAICAGAIGTGAFWAGMTGVAEAVPFAGGAGA